MCMNMGGGGVLRFGLEGKGGGQQEMRTGV